jgi:hypothetical protein
MSRRLTTSSQTTFGLRTKLSGVITLSSRAMVMSSLGCLGVASIVFGDAARSVAQQPSTQALPSGPAGQAGPGGQSSAPYYTDPATGIVYRRVHRTIERPIVETQVQPQESTVYRPETVIESRPETRTVYTPVVKYDWQPKVKNRWNPFVQPTLHYEHTPRTHWEARNETIEKKEYRTNWVAEKRRVEVPQQVVRIQREEKIDYEPVGRVAPQVSQPPGSVDAAIAARLRPLDSSAPIVPYGAAPGGSVGSIASSSTRSSDQVGLRATELQPNGYSLPLPPATGGVARSPMTPIWR